jgi:uncharacterized protein YjbI with pentapeptide repeats
LQALKQLFLFVYVTLRERFLAKLRKADFTGAQLQGAQLAGADLREAKFNCAASWKECAQLHGASLVGAKLLGASFVRAELQGAILANAQLQGAKLLSARLHGAILSNAQLQGATLDSAELYAASFEAAHLQGAVLDYAQLQGADLSNAELQGASLNSTQLQGATLQGTNLRAASLRNVSVWRADARNATVANIASVVAQTSQDAGCLRANVNIDGPCDQLSNWIQNIKDTISETILDVKTRDRALDRIGRLEPTREVEGEIEMAKQWANLSASSGQALNSSNLVVQQFRATSCSAQGAPYVIRQMIDRLGTFGADEAAKLAKEFMDVEHCSGAKELTGAEKAKLNDLQEGTITP